MTTTSNATDYSYEHLCCFTVRGEPATQGSKRAFPFKRKDGTLGASVVSVSNKKLKSWRAVVSDAATEAYGGELISDPIRLTVILELKRPKNHYGTGRNSMILKKNAPIFHYRNKDAIKMVRAIEDAITGIVWRNDCQIAEHRIVKRWSPGGSMAHIEIDRIVEHPSEV